MPVIDESTESAAKMAGSTKCNHLFRVSTTTTAKDSSSPGWADEQRPPDSLCPWSPGRTAGEDNNSSSSNSSTSGAPEVVLVFANADAVRECQTCRGCFAGTFDMPDFWWSQSCRRSGGYFGSDSRRDEGGALVGLNTWCLFQIKQLQGKDYVWYKLNIFTKWIAATRQTAIVVFEGKTPPPTDFSELFLANHKQQQQQQQQKSPLWPYAKILSAVTDLQNTTVWDIRTQVRKLEKSRKRSGQPDFDFHGLHDLARHAIHVSETLDVGIKTAKLILEHHEWFMEDVKADTTQLDKTRRIITGAARNVHERLQFFNTMIESHRDRSASNRARLLNEIQLSFQESANYSSDATIQIAKATRRDGRDMRTIAYLTMAFLPATFISALFSTSFFSYEQDTGRWGVSDQFWIYWAFAVPATVLTAFIWYVRMHWVAWWKGYERRREEKKEEKKKKKLEEVEMDVLRADMKALENGSIV